MENYIKVKSTNILYIIIFQSQITFYCKNYQKQISIMKKGITLIYYFNKIGLI